MPAPTYSAVLIIRLFISHAIAVPRHHQRRHHHRRFCDVVVVVFLLSRVCTFACFHPSLFPNFVRGYFVDNNITVPLPLATTTATTTKEKANNCNFCALRKELAMV
jgi:hypothetical protein